MMRVVTVGVILKILIMIVDGNRLANTKLHTLLLDHKKIKLSWLIDWNKQEVMFNVDNAFSAKNKWFSFGFSKRGDMEQSDLCLFTKENDIFDVAVDAYVGDDGNIYKDVQQDCHVLRMDDKSVAFKRKFSTCDPQDFDFHEGTMYVLWSQTNDTVNFSQNSEATPQTSIMKENFSTQHRKSSSLNTSGMVMGQLLRADKLEIPEKNVEEVTITLNKIKVPAKDTTYWCRIQKLDDFVKRKHHIVQFEPIITSPSIVHHMEVFHCETDVDVDIPLYEGNCDDLPTEAKVCSRVISLWAMGASTFTYPRQAGLPIGGPSYNPYIRLEVHFNNPDILDGIVDSSGMKIKIISELREFDAAIMELGLEYTDKMAIPQGLTAFPLSGYCISDCTKAALPSDGITIFGSQLHTHLRGVRILTRHFRGATELLPVNRDDYYSHHFQEIRTLRYKPNVLPGDALVTTCYYTTEGYNQTVLGGFAISDEMCVNYIQYYPATKLEVCKSSVSEKTLEDYFNYMHNKEHQKSIQIDGARSDNYRSIEWTKSRVDELWTMYTQEPLSMQCNRSDGFRFDGFEWEGSNVTPVTLQIPVQSGKCENYNPFGVIPLEQGKCGFLGECIY
ncbi:tyramine beta-hydroxylase [Bradysia coprophila]|uniref:tyramine beta-hydroxylase n=1 Tax=Bradysia coprophila TaxID=38358 RepID=UPI00187DD896|nr:tyramine beta-hydroxylase [Bradysia coprophila]